MSGLACHASWGTLTTAICVGQSLASLISTRNQHSKLCTTYAHTQWGSNDSSWQLQTNKTSVKKSTRDKTSSDVSHLIFNSYHTSNLRAILKMNLLRCTWKVFGVPNVQVTTPRVRGPHFISLKHRKTRLSTADWKCIKITGLVMQHGPASFKLNRQSKCNTSGKSWKARNEEHISSRWCSIFICGRNSWVDTTRMQFLVPSILMIQS